MRSSSSAAGDGVYILGAWRSSNTVPANELEDLAKSETTFSDNFMIFRFVSGESLQVLLRVFAGSKLGNDAE